MVLVTEISRLSRSLKDFCHIWDMMREYGCDFQSLREQFDSTTAAGEMVLFTVANIAQFERRQISEPVRANEILKKNHRRVRYSQANRYPFLLTGLVVCGVCGDTMCGKSANGNGGKIPYYEHSWATKRQACLNKKIMACQPTRIGARKLEPRVWDEVMKLLTESALARDWIERAQSVH